MNLLSRYGLIFFTGILLFSIPLQAQAMTTGELGTILKKNGLDVGVESALTAGMDLNNILTTSMTLEDTNPQIILVAMCRAGANGADLRAAAMTQGISPLLFASAMETCASTTEEDTQAYTPVQARVTARSRTVGATAPTEPYASPSTL